MTGGPDRGAGPHGMPDQHHGDRAVGGGDGIEFLVEVDDGRRLRAVPSAYPEARPENRDVAPPQGGPDSRGDGDHAHDGGLQRTGGLGAGFLAAMGHQDHAGDARWRAAVRAGAVAGIAVERLAARHLPSRRLFSGRLFSRCWEAWPG
jgi:hypothetical protein